MGSQNYTSKARIAFEKSSWDIYHLFDIHDELISNRLVQRSREKADVLVRSTYMFITASWESFAEDLCDEALSCLLRNTLRGKKWMGNVLRKHGTDLIQALNTPRSKNIDTLYSDTIGLIKLSNSWHWNGMTSQQARSKLGTYVEIRCAIAHRTRTLRPISRNTAEEYLDFIRTLASKTERRVQGYVKRIIGNNFGKRNRG